MDQHGKADQARKGLIDSVKGKAKEVAGAVTGNDSLTAEGQLEQTQAKRRKDANAVDAVADAEAKAARDEAAEAHAEAAAQRNSVRASTAAAEDSVDRQQDSREQEVARAARNTAVAEQVQADLDTQRDVQQAEREERAATLAADAEAVDAADEYRHEAGAAAAQKDQADRLRQRAERLTDQADLS